MAMRFKPKLDASKQNALMMEYYTGFKFEFDKGCGIWTGQIQPTPLSVIYNIQIKFKRSPKVFVISPKLKCREDNPIIPHLYSDGSLCLFYNEWTPDKFIANTIIPWTSLWLYYYEIWRAIGEWLGGGLHPAASFKKIVQG